MVEGVEEFRAEFETLRFCHPEFLSQRPIEHVLSGTGEDVASRVAEGEACGGGESIDVKPMIGSSLTGRQVAVPELIRPGYALGTGVRRVSIVQVGRERKSARQSVDAAQVPSAERKIYRAIVDV